ncbi:DNA repair protein RecO [Candidatus Bipolaricaulota bacterium]|nr:DNA repair protein RecO [Candidatus Bipolaricaulota bacterium]
MARLSRARGIVLRTQDHAETDRIAILLTPNFGRLDLLAKGARRLDRPSGAALDVLNLVDVIFYLRSGLALLRAVDLAGTFPNVRGDLDRLGFALAGVRWALRLVPRHAADPDSYKLLLGFLSALERGGPPRQLYLAYILGILSATGHRPHLDGCVRCGGERDLTWSPELGGLLCMGCGGEGEMLTPRLVHTLRGLARLPLSAAGKLRAEEGDLRAIEGLLHRFGEVQLSR